MIHTIYVPSDYTDEIVEALIIMVFKFVPSLYVIEERNLRKRNRKVEIPTGRINVATIKTNNPRRREISFYEEKELVDS